MSLLFETIKIADGIPCHLSWHNERLNRSRREFWPVKDDLDLTSIIRVPQEYQQGIVRCNVYYEKGIEQITFNRYSRKEIKNLRLVESPGIDYHVKYTDRSALDLLLDQKEGCDEILIEVGGLITDTTISNIAFFDGKNWITPEKP